MNRLRELRKKKSLSLKEESEELRKNKLKITPDALAKYERGDREPKLETWQKLADFFGVSVPYLQGLTDFKGDSVAEYLLSNDSTNDDEVINRRVNEVVSIAYGRRIEQFYNMSKAILNEKNEYLTPTDIEECKKVISNIPIKNLVASKNVVDMGKVISDISELYVIMINALFTKKKGYKEVLKEIQNIINKNIKVDDKGLRIKIISEKDDADKFDDYIRIDDRDKRFNIISKKDKADDN